MLLKHKNARGLSSLFCLCVALAGLLFARAALAEGINGQEAPDDKSEMYHSSLLKLPASTRFPVSRRVKLGLNKSILVELPVEIRDVLVSNPKVVEAVVSSSNRVYLIGMEMGQANAFLFDKNGEQILTLEISIERDTVTLKRLLKRLIPNSDIQLELLNDTIVLTGSVRTPSDSARASKLAARFVTRPGEENKVDTNKVINMLTVQSKEQVLLKVTVAEMNRNMLKQMGVNLGASINVTDLAITALTANAFPLGGSLLPNTLGFGFDGSSFGQVFTGSTLQDSGAAFYQRSGANTYGQAIRALERNGIIKTLAEPNLTAISGETASFLAGGEFPIPVSQDNGTISVEWKPFGVGLSFTPMVLAEERISMKISTEVSELTNEGAVQVGNFSIQGLQVRKTDTTVELPSGGALVISGLISNQTKENIDGIPGIKNLPVLGKLFRSRDFIKNETELIVLVTPYLVNPVSRSQVARPDQGFAPASDLEAKLLGYANRVHGKTDGYGLKDGGDYGFIVE